MKNRLSFNKEKTNIARGRCFKKTISCYLKSKISKVVCFLQHSLVHLYEGFLHVIHDISLFG